MPDSHLNRPGSPSRKRGAPQGNTNALKHGYYARVFRPTEQDDLSKFDPDSLNAEIDLLRVFIRRTAGLAGKVNNLQESMTLLNVLAKATLSLASLARTRHLAAAAHDHAEFQELIHKTRAAFERAGSLAQRLNESLANSETACDAVQSALELLFPPPSPSEESHAAAGRGEAKSKKLDGECASSLVLEAKSKMPDGESASSLAPSEVADSLPEEDSESPDEPIYDPFAGLAAILSQDASSTADSPQSAPPAVSSQTTATDNVEQEQEEEDDDDGTYENEDEEDETEEEDAEEEESVECKIPFDCFTCTERAACDSCPPRIKAALLHPV